MENEVKVDVNVEVQINQEGQQNIPIVQEQPKKKSNKVEIIKGIISYLLFNNLVLVIAILAMILIPSLDLEDGKTLVVLDVISSSILGVILLILYKDLVISDKNEIKKLGKQGFSAFIEKCISGFIIFFVIKLGASILESTVFDILGLEYVTSENQSLIEDLLDSAPALMCFSACICAPIVEELVFRGAIGKMIKNKKVFITVSGLIFGLIHVTDSTVFIFEITLIGLVLDYFINTDKFDKSDKILLSVISTVLILIVFGGIYYFQYGNLILKLQSLVLSEVIGSITYIIMGVFLAWYYVKNNSILLNMGIHALNNILSMIMLLNIG